MDGLLNSISKTVRGWMMVPAKALNNISGGKITPNHVTVVSLLGHFFVLWALYVNRPVMAALFLAFFGIMDALDGALSRVQKSSSVQGMFYDAVSDRAKEVIVYAALAIYIEQNNYYAYGLTLKNITLNNLYLWLPLTVLGLSMLVSYIKAKGEMALSSKNTDVQTLNRVFSDGFARYEVRMTIIIIGLLTGRIIIALYILLALLVVTCMQRFYKVSKALK
jgi:phosphatidylglycerophosphate synthase